MFQQQIDLLSLVAKIEDAAAWIVASCKGIAT
jgi:hypothetical protein